MYFLVYRLASELFAFVVLFFFTILLIVIKIKESNSNSIFKEIIGSKQIKVIVGIILIWIGIAVFSLIDIQLGNRLYFNIVAYDYQTRVSVIDAITRTGVPPINPSYYPGAPVRLTFLYYFWYILCSIIDKLGGDVVTARTALIASVIWAGIALMASIAFYLRMRNNTNSVTHWRNATIGIGLLAVSGLDIFGSTFYLFFPKYLYGYFINGDIEHWNEQITAWAGTTMWTPHHLVSLLNCMIGWMLINYHEGKKMTQKVGSATLAGVAFASAFGLSSWVTLIFVLFWFYWIIARLLRGESIKTIWIMSIPGFFAAVFISPFLLDLFVGTGASSSPSIQPLAIDVRWFRPAIHFIINTPSWYSSLVSLLFLPFNYFLELGFFFFAGTLWYQYIKNNKIERIKLWKEEIALLTISIVLTSFTRSTLIANNDFGWRGWLPGQFILLVWGVDVISNIFYNKPLFTSNNRIKSDPLNKMKFWASALITLGILTSIQDVIFLRFWPILVDKGIIILPEEIRSDEYLGTKIFEARVGFTLVSQNYSSDTIVQFNPDRGFDRSFGLYRMNPTVFSYHTLYGIPSDDIIPLAQQIRQYFFTENTNWNSLDKACKQYKINILIISDTDEIWRQIPHLTATRQPIYSGNHYVFFECGV
jgi:hypothetical protein